MTEVLDRRDGSYLAAPIAGDDHREFCPVRGFTDFRNFTDFEPGGHQGQALENLLGEVPSWRRGTRTAAQRGVKGGTNMPTAQVGSADGTDRPGQPTPQSDTEARRDQLRLAQRHLRRADAVIGRFIELRSDFDPRAWLDELPPMDLFGALLFQIAGQQLSVAATRRTVERLTSLFGGHLPSPVELLAVGPGDLRAAGLSWRKVNTLRDLAERLTDGRLDMQRLSQLPDDDFISELTAVPGIGPWTAQGALLVALRREDVVLPGDLALPKPCAPPIILTTYPVRTRSSKSRTSGARTAASPRRIYSPPRTNRATPRQRRDKLPGSPAVAGVLPGGADRVRSHAAHRSRRFRATGGPFLSYLRDPAVR